MFFFWACLLGLGIGIGLSMLLSGIIESEVLLAVAGVLLILSGLSLSVAVIAYRIQDYEDAAKQAADRQHISVSADGWNEVITSTSGPCQVKLEMQNNQLVVAGSNVVATPDKLQTICQ